MREIFLKTSALNEEDRKKLIDYWNQLWGSDFTSHSVKDYKPEGKKKKVEK